jgi:hypothetical protein
MPPTITNNMVMMTVRELFSANPVIPFMFDSSCVREDKIVPTQQNSFLCSYIFVRSKVQRFRVQGSGLRTNRALRPGSASQIDNPIFCGSLFICGLNFRTLNLSTSEP